MRKVNTDSTPQAQLRGVFYCILSIILASCESKTPETPDWSAPQKTEANQPAATPKPSEGKLLAETTSQQASKSETVLMVYNLRNYLSMKRTKDGVESLRPKPEHELTDLISNITQVSPDILGVSEVGTQADLLDLQSRLGKAGIDYPYIHLSGGSDPYRRLAVLSQIKLETHSSADLGFTLDGKKHRISRGISDVSISTAHGPVRLLGVHLKSKRPSKHWDQELIRRHESHAVRRHVDSILQQPHQRLLLYGDFNDTKQSPAIRAIKGDRNGSLALRALSLKASDGSRWTHYWEYQDVYSRFDYVFSSASLQHSIVTKKCYILDIQPDDRASDHRPLVITFY